VALLPLHTAIELAEQIALVDIISDGRVEPGFGVGYRKPEYQAFGGEFKRRYGVYAERIRELRRLWGEEPGAERTVTPPPVQHPIPLWGGFGGPMGARTAGRLGLGLQSIDRSLLDPYQEGLAAGGFGADRARLAGSIEFIVSDDPERTRAQLAPHVAYRYESYNRYMFEGTRHKTDQPPHFDPRALTDRLVVGTAEQVAAEIRTRVAGMPVTDVYSWSDYPGIDDEVIDRHIELTFREVAPLLRD
jgi:alkanesulfonate monooxygenase SsuD/methylene tetrahydromethanopterin reductase-like flavin-dependent oxidoreductase (luciferase family)